MGFPRAEDVRTLFHSPHLKRLKSLSLLNCLLGRNLDVLVGSPVFEHLTRLDLEGNRLDRRSTTRLLAALKPGQLRSLSLARNRQDHMPAELIARHDWGHRLEELDLSGNS